MRERAPISIRLTPDEHERWREEALQRGTTLAAFVRDCVAAALEARWQPGDPERRQDRRSLLTATRTGADGHRWDDDADAPLSRDRAGAFR